MHAIGRSRGGLSTKVHLVVDALGWPAHGLVAVAVADYVFDQFEAGPSRFAFGLSLNSVGVDGDGDGDGDEAGIESYTKARSEVECTFNLLKQARRFATRYEKTLRNYAAVVAVGCAILWLRI